jgi:hypothetical protein
MYAQQRCVQSRVASRNDDYATVIRKLNFGKAASALTVGDTAASPNRPSPSASALQHSLPSTGLADSDVISTADTASTIAAATRAKAELSSVAYRSARATVWMGDFNYRIDLERCALPIKSTQDARMLQAQAASDAMSLQVANDSISTYLICVTDGLEGQCLVEAYVCLQRSSGALCDKWTPA